MEMSHRRPGSLDRLHAVRGGNGAAHEGHSPPCVASDTPATVATRRDPVGRILVPVRINERGPFYLVANTGANTVALSEQVRRRLKLSLNEEQPVIVHGVTGSTTVPVARVTSMTLGGVAIPATALPILGDAFEGSDGMLGLIGLARGQLRLDMGRQTLTLSNVAMPNHAEPGTVSIPLDVSHSRVLVVDTRIQGIVVKTIIDTGAQSTIGNLPLRRALGGRDVSSSAMIPIVGATSERQTGESQPLQPVSIGTLRIVGARICYGQVPLLDRLGLANRPAMLLGMDVLGQMGKLILDHAHRTVQFVPRSGKRNRGDVGYRRS